MQFNKHGIAKTFKFKFEFELLSDRSGTPALWMSGTIRHQNRLNTLESLYGDSS